MIQLNTYDINPRGGEAIITPFPENPIYLNANSIICLNVYVSKTSAIVKAYPDIKFPLYKVVVQGMASPIYVDDDGFKSILNYFKKSNKTVLKENI